jgi:hypothetical protein
MIIIKSKKSFRDRSKKSTRDKSKKSNKDKENEKDKNKEKGKTLIRNKIPNNERNLKKKQSNKIKNESNLIKTLPFDIQEVTFEKEKTYTIQKIKGLMPNNYNGTNNNNEKNMKKNTTYVRYRNINDKNNNDNFNKIMNGNNNKSPTYVKNNKSPTYVKNNKSTTYVNNNKSTTYVNNKSPTYVKNRNMSNVYIDSTTYKNDKGFETHNHFYSVRNKYKRLALKRDNMIKNSLTNMQAELDNEKYNNNTRRSKIFNISHNVSPKITKRFDENKDNENDEKPKYNHNTKLRNHFLSKNMEEEKLIYVYEKEKSKDIKYSKLRMNFEPKARYSKSHMKYNYDKDYNDTSKNGNEIKRNKFSIRNTYKKQNKMAFTEANKKNNKDNNNDIDNDKSEDQNNPKNNQFSYVLNSTNPKNKSITYFNIRVIDNKVEEGKNNTKLNKNNAFFFSRYSRANKYNDNDN